MNTKRILFLLPLIIYSGIIYYFSDQEQIKYLNFDFHWEDKIKHFFAFLLYGFLTFLALKDLSFKPKKKYLLVLLIGSIYGFSDEFHQYFVEGRSSDIYDWIADVVGVVISILIHFIYFKITLSFSKNQL